MVVPKIVKLKYQTKGKITPFDGLVEGGASRVVNSSLVSEAVMCALADLGIKSNDLPPEKISANRVNPRELPQGIDSQNPPAAWFEFSETSKGNETRKFIASKKKMEEVLKRFSGIQNLVPTTFIRMYLRNDIIDKLTPQYVSSHQDEISNLMMQIAMDLTRVIDPSKIHDLDKVKFVLPVNNKET